MNKKYVFISVEYIGRNDMCITPLLHEKIDPVFQIVQFNGIYTDENLKIISSIETEFICNGMGWLINILKSTTDKVIIIFPSVQVRDYMVNYINKDAEYKNNSYLKKCVMKSIVLIEYMKIQNRVDGIKDGYDKDMTVVHSRFYAICKFGVSSFNDYLLEFMGNKASMSIKIMKKVVETIGIEDIVTPKPKEIKYLTNSTISKKIELKLKNDLAHEKNKKILEENNIQSTHSKDICFSYKSNLPDSNKKNKLYVSKHAIDRYMERDFRVGESAELASEIFNKFISAKLICDVGDGLIEYYLAEGMLLLVVRNVSINTKRILTVLKPTKQKMDAIKEIMILQRRLEGRLSKESFDECNRNLNSYKMVLVGDDFKDYMYRKK